MPIDLSSTRGEGPGSDSGIFAADLGRRAAPDGIPPAVASGRRRGWDRAVRAAVPAVIDAACVTAAAVAAFAVWAGGRLGQPAAVYLPMLPALALVPLANGASGLYPGLGLGPVELLRRQWRNASGVFLALVVSTFALQLPREYSRMTLALAWIGTLILLPLGRSVSSRLLAARPWFAEPAVVVGGGSRAASLVGKLRRRAHLGYRPVALLAPAPPEASPGEGVTIPVHPLEAASSFAAAGVKVALVAEQDPVARRMLTPALQQLFPHVIVLGDPADLPVERVELRNIGGALGVEYTNQLMWPRNRFVKRALDLVLGTAGLLPALPVIAVAAVLVKLSSRDRRSSPRSARASAARASGSRSCARCSSMPRSACARTSRRTPERGASGSGASSWAVIPG